MTSTLTEVAVSSLLIVLVDTIWLALFMLGHFEKLVKNVQCDKEMSARAYVVVIAYVFLCLGFYLFIVREDKGYFHAFILGLVIYGVYESTNFAIFKDWTFKTFVIDTLWGGVLYTVCLFLYKALENNVFNKVK